MHLLSIYVSETQNVWHCTEKVPDTKHKPSSFCFNDFLNNSIAGHSKNMFKTMKAICKISVYSQKQNKQKLKRQRVVYIC